MWFIVLIHGKTQKKTEPDSGLLATEERRIARNYFLFLFYIHLLIS